MQYRVNSADTWPPIKTRILPYRIRYILPNQTPGGTHDGDYIYPPGELDALARTLTRIRQRRHLRLRCLKEPSASIDTPIIVGS